MTTEELYEVEDYPVWESSLRWCLRKGDVERAAYSAAWLITYRKEGSYVVWRQLLAFPAEELGGKCLGGVLAHYLSWKDYRNHSNTFAAIIFLCELMTGEPVLPARPPGQLMRWVDELKNAAFYWVNGARPMDPPEGAFDVHAGFGTIEGWWEDVNKLGPASPWRDDAVAGAIAQERQRQLSEELKEDAETGRVSFA